jgi:glycyl-tRNA synthetase beta chain
MEIVAINPDNLDSAALELKEFIKQRLENLLAEEEVRYDIINAVIKINDQDLLDLYQRAHKLMEFRSENASLFIDLIRGLVRAKNISEKSENKLEIDAGLLVEDEEKELYKAFEQREAEINEFFASGQYQKGFYLLVELKEYIDAFLDNVMVMVEDRELKNNRLALLNNIAELMSEVVDIEEIALD